MGGGHRLGGEILVWLLGGAAMARGVFGTHPGFRAEWRIAGRV